MAFVVVGFSLLGCTRILLCSSARRSTVTEVYLNLLLIALKFSQLARATLALADVSALLNVLKFSSSQSVQRPEDVNRVRRRVNSNGNCRQQRRSRPRRAATETVSKGRISFLFLPFIRHFQRESHNSTAHSFADMLTCQHFPARGTSSLVRAQCFSPLFSFSLFVSLSLSPFVSLSLSFV